MIFNPPQNLKFKKNHKPNLLPHKIWGSSKITNGRFMLLAASSAFLTIRQLEAARKIIFVPLKCIEGNYG